MTQTPVCLYRISNDDLALAFRRDPELAFALTRMLTTRMAENLERATQAVAAMRLAGGT